MHLSLLLERPTPRLNPPHRRHHHTLLTTSLRMIAADIPGWDPSLSHRDEGRSAVCVCVCVSFGRVSSKRGETRPDQGDGDHTGSLFTDGHVKGHNLTNGMLFRVNV